MLYLQSPMVNIRSLSSVTSSTLSDRLSALPDDILSHMLSFLTLCDSTRARLLSPRWRYLSDNRSALEFDAPNVLRVSPSECCKSYLDESLDPSKFVKGVDEFLEIWKDRKLRMLKVNFFLSNKHALHIDKWIKRGIRMDIVILELHFNPFSSEDDYVLSDKLFHYGKAFHLKHLWLRHCALILSSDCISWISHLSSLQLDSVTLHQKDIECIMSGGLNLTSLSLKHCENPIALARNVELPSLKELIISYCNFRLIELNCPNLESFNIANGVDCCKYSHVPLLKKVTVSVPRQSNCSFSYDKLARHVPNLQALTIYGNAEVGVQSLPSNGTMSRLKWLSLVFLPLGFDLLSITHLLNASPFLEILHLMDVNMDFPEQNPRRKYVDCPHFRLREVEIQGHKACNFIELTQYLLNNAIALERVVILEDCACSKTGDETGSEECPIRKEVMAYPTSYCFEEMATDYCYSRREEMATALLQNIQSTVELVFKTYRGVVLNASNRMGHGVDHVYPRS